MGPRPFTEVPPSAAWLHNDARIGFEVVHFRQEDGGHLAAGCTTAHEGGRSWIVDYEIHLNEHWVTCTARVRARLGPAPKTVSLDHDGVGGWRIDGVPAPHLDGCFDIDLESSAMTNALPVHRHTMRANEPTSAPAAYVRAVGLEVERLEQRYTRVNDDAHRYDYRAPAFDFGCELIYDESGLVLHYPGIAHRAG